MRAQEVGWIVLTVVLAGLPIACSNSTTAPSTVSSVSVSGTAPALGAGAQFTATATLSNGTTQDVTSLATWQSSDTTEATVSSTGVVTAIAAGTVNVTATYQSVTGTEQITLTP
jgi:uncharacterized protein YjdB